VYRFDGKQFVSYECTGNEALIVFPDEPHISGSSGLDPCDMYALQCDLSESESFLGLNPEAGEKLCRALMSLRGRHIMLDPTAYMLLHCAFERFAAMTEEGYVEAAAFLSCFLYTLIHLPCVDNSAALETPNDRINRVLTYIEENIAQPLTLTELSEIAGYSLSRFKTLFRQVTGQTPAQYIAMSKVEKAKIMLRDERKSITDIAYDLGWSSSNYFCAVFKKFTNVSPLIYRKTHHGK
jgi:AraC-type DNA-binding domain-containing proteins